MTRLSRSRSGGGTPGTIRGRSGRRHALRIAPLHDDAFLPVRDLLNKHAGVPMSIADACPVRLTEILPDPLLPTTGSDFRIHRRLGRKAMPTRMP